MHINIVTVSSGWILQKIAERIAAGNTDKNVEFTVTHKSDDNADVNFYVDLFNCYFGQKTKCDVAFLTHAHENSKDFLLKTFKERNAFDLKGITCQNQRYIDMSEDIGYPIERMKTILHGDISNFPLKKTTIGIVSRGGFPGYGHHFMVNMLTSYEFDNFKIRFLGKGWEDVVQIGKALKIDIETDSSEDYGKYPEFYQSIDYLLIPTLWTAGPISMQEALACGTPIIGSNVGFVNYEYVADHVYEPGDIEGLSKILNFIQKPLLNRRKQVENLSYEKYSNDLIKFIKELQ